MSYKIKCSNCGKTYKDGHICGNGMTDKDQLEEIERIVGMHGGSIIFIKREYVNWLIEQAEQLNELKESIHTITTVRKSIYESHEQVYLIKKAVNDL